MKPLTFLKKYGEEAKQLIHEGKLADIEFSGETYQVQLLRDGEDAWAFLQLDEKDQPKDHFCSCSEGDEEDYCVHLAAAYLAIFRGYAEPLHRRFESSFWNCLMQGVAEGREELVPKLSVEGLYALDQLISIRAKDDKARQVLKSLFEDRPEQTEETSLKFSNLEEKEIDLWMRGHPSPQLRYELSAWSDFAKVLMLRQDQACDYRIGFEGEQAQLPKKLKVTFPDIELKLSLDRAIWLRLVPGLASVDSPLHVQFSEEEGIERILYDEKTRSLSIEAKKGSAKELSGIELGDWLYVPGKGFFSQEVHHLLAMPKVPKNLVPKVLSEHAPVLRRFLEGTRIDESPIALQVHIDFDASWDLHLSCYLEKPGDLDAEESYHFGKWIYRAGDGFYRLDEDQPKSFRSVIPSEEIPEFIARRRHWIQQQPGFQVHLASVDTYLDYRLSDNKRLFFESRLELDEEGNDVADFGPWLYVKGQGFFSRSQHPLARLASRQGLSKTEIPSFIRKNREDLKHVKAFFSKRSPIQACQLQLQIFDGENLRFTPQYQLNEGYSLGQLRFFDDFVYCEGEGFHEIPPEIRLPERFREEKIVGSHLLPTFLEESAEKVIPYLTEESPSLLVPKQLNIRVQDVQEQSSQRGMVDLKLVYESELGNVGAAEIWQAIDEGRGYCFSEAGLLDLQQTRYDFLRDIGEEQVDLEHNRLIVSTLQLIRLDAFEDLDLPEKLKGEEDLWHPILASAFDFDPDEKPPIRGLKSKLRPYQKAGLQWLWQLYRCHLSAMLCDDMGLGKTHQSMALLTAVKSFRKKEKPRFLVVCPTSVIYHWEDKLEEFLPGFSVHTFYGPQRDSKAAHKHSDILLTSYGVLRRDQALLKDIPFELAVFDEIQIAKNHLSAVHGALKQLQVNMRLGLTGTPIENRIRELKALFDIVLPGYMPTESRYRDLFIVPIEKNFDGEKQALLSRMIKPFVLRRKKEEVLDDLPDKTEEIAHCELATEQRKLYHDTIHQAKTGVIRDLEDQEKVISYTHIFALLTSLKQICNHPAVYLKDVQGYKNYHSGKWNLFVELLKEARDSQQKVVVFSQYLGMMDIIENYLHEQKIGFASIRGATKDRADQLKRFQNDPECEVFVASLQAAGLGIDLTAASVVILYDRWWNAAREKQAIDRVHRIGQKRGVQVFKLISKDSFEERIDEIIRRKGKLMEDVVGTDGENFLKLLDRDDLLELLRDVNS